MTSSAALCHYWAKKRPIFWTIFQVFCEYMCQNVLFQDKKAFAKSRRPKDSEYIFRFVLGVVGQILELAE